MMNPVSYALTQINFRIPKELLEKTFVDRTKYVRFTPQTLGENIKATVLRPRVFVDCDVVGGTEVLIRIANFQTDRPDDFTAIYQIPKSATQNRSISSVLNVTFNDPTGISYYGMSSGCQSTQMMATSMALLDSAGTIPVTSTAQVSLIGENVVMVRDTTILPANAFLRCILASDENWSHLQMRVFRKFADLCVLAVKSYIYKTLVIEVDQAELSGGFQLGRFREVLDGYADSEELYQEYLTEKWQKISLMNDHESWTRHLRGVVGGHR